MIEDDKALELDKLEFWKSLPQNLFHKTYEVENRGAFDIVVDFQNIIKNECLNIEYIKNLKSADRLDFSNLLPLQMNFKVSTQRRAEQSVSQNLCSYAAENYLYEMFLILNLSYPCCFDCSGAVFSATTDVESAFNPIELSSELIELYKRDIKAYGIPSYQKISVEKAKRWIESLDLSVNQVAKGATQQAVFSLLNFTNGKFVSPISILWLVNALESLYKTKSGENRSGLISRASNLLSISDPHEDKKFKKGFDAFYKTRSKIVHGGYSVPHPHGNDILDPMGVEEDFKEMEAPIAFALGTIISTFQRMILDDILELNYRDVLTPIKIQSTPFPP
jgi:hypothetical protein